MTRRAALLNMQSPMTQLLDRQREAARLFALGHTNKEVADALGYHPAYMPALKRQEKFAEAKEELASQRDSTVRDITSRIRTGASSGLDMLVRILSPDTAESKLATIGQKISVAQDLLDREGTAPKVTKQKQSGEMTHLHVTPADIAELKRMREERRAARAVPAEVVEVVSA